MREMTQLTKTIARVSQQEYCVLHHRRARPIVVCLLTHDGKDSIQFSEKRGRKKFYLSIEGAMRIAVKMTVEADRKKAQAARKAKREGRAFSA